MNFMFESRCGDISPLQPDQTRMTEPDGSTQRTETVETSHRSPRSTEILRSLTLLSPVSEVSIQRLITDIYHFALTRQQT